MRRNLITHRNSGAEKKKEARSTVKSAHNDIVEMDILIVSQISYTDKKYKLFKDFFKIYIPCTVVVLPPVRCQPTTLDTPRGGYGWASPAILSDLRPKSDCRLTGGSKQ